MIKTPKIAILEYELIVNQKLFDNGAITEHQYRDVCNIIYNKISYCSTEESC